MTKLSSPDYDLKYDYPVVVIGSGYGGAVLASRLARARQSVCLLERGKEFEVGEFPNNEMDAMKNLQITGVLNNNCNPLGLYHICLDQEISAFVGCGLGGTSLVNANVALRANQNIFKETDWPKEFLADLDTLWVTSTQHAENMLKPTPYPENFPVLMKLNALEKSAKALNTTYYRPPINVTFKDGINHVGVEQKTCQLCGDCVSGCNYAAKNTLMMNYLPDAKQHGAAIFTRIKVRYIERQNNRWIVYYENLNQPTHENSQLHFLITDFLIIAAGTLGTTEILLRSKSKGLSLSNQVGSHFSGNGDVLAFSYHTDDIINGVGYGATIQSYPVGPCITGIIDARGQNNNTQDFVIEEGAIPGAMKYFLPEIFRLSAHFAGVQMSSFANMTNHQNELENFFADPYQDAMRHTQTYLVMSHDDRQGKLILENDTLHIDWPHVGEQHSFNRINEQLQKAAQPLGGTFVPNPIWSNTSQHTLVTVHPLGGCIMANNAEKGVVNHKGQVFCSAQGDEVYANLYICDGSIIPQSLAVNPLLTITALAEREAALIAKDRNLTIDYTFSNQGLPMKEDTNSKNLGLTFTETMRGKLSTSNLNEDANINILQDEHASDFEFTLTIVITDLKQFLNDENHRAKIKGQVSIPILSKQPLVVTDGEFQLFTEDKNNIATRQMCYNLSLYSIEDQHYEFEGKKIIHDDQGIDLWNDTTTLYVTLYQNNKNERYACAKGILKILTADFMRQLTTIRILNAKNKEEELLATSQFGNFFAGTLYQLYGGIFSRSTFFDPNSPPRQKRALKVKTPEIHAITTQDHQQLRLTRYQGGNKGPVLLLHGLGVSSLIFAIDTIEVNLLEYLYAHEYDVWLLDYRASIDLASSQQSFNADVIANQDYPKAIEHILKVTQQKDLQVVAHCFGATTFCMAMLAGLRGVRSIVFSQIATHFITNLLAQIKTGLYMPTFLQRLGVSSLTAYADTNENWQEKLFDTALKVTSFATNSPCQNPVCRRITFLYSQLYEHDQLNSQTHDSLHEMFGIANIRAFEHLALMVRKGHLVNENGEESYLPHLNRLALPITFIHGEKNQCFLPESTAITYDLLRKTNGEHFYNRHVIPNYGHIDCIFGKHAVDDVYPHILAHLEKYAITNDQTSDIKTELTTK